jgi:hypothetical protein
MILDGTIRDTDNRAGTDKQLRKSTRSRFQDKGHAGTRKICCRVSITSPSENDLSYVLRESILQRSFCRKKDFHYPVQPEKQDAEYNGGIQKYDNN